MLRTPSTEVTAEDSRVTASSRRLGLGEVRRLVSRFAVVIALIGFSMGYTIALPGSFPTVGNVQTMVNSQGVLLILSLALTVPLVAGEFDLSVAAVLGFVGPLLAALHGVLHWGAPMAIAVTLLACVAIGIFNVILIVVVGVDSFIATLSSSTILAGLTLYVTNGQILTTVPHSLQRFAFLGIPALGVETPALTGIALAALLWYVYEHTPAGRYLYFVGEGREAARLSGLPVDRVRALALISASLISGVAGLLLAGQLGGVAPSLGPSYLLPAFAGAFLGATTIRPGRFNAWGTVVAVYMLVVAVTGLELLGMASWVQQVFDGCALAMAVAFARIVGRRDLQ